MKSLRYLVTFMFVMAVTITARNQDSKQPESIDEGLFVVKAVCVDSSGVKWFGTNRGLYRFDDLTWCLYTDEDYLVGNQVNALFLEQTPSGPALWVATTEGVSLVQIDATGLTGSTGYSTAEGLLDNDVADIALDSYHGKYFGSAGGISWLHDGTMDQITYTEYYSSMVDNPVRQMSIYGDTLYIAQDGGIGRFISGVDGITGASRWASEYGMTPFTENIQSVLVKGEERQYFGTDVGVETHTSYFAKENWDLLSTDSGLIHNDVISIAEDEQGGVWFGTLGGVSYYDHGAWTSYTTLDGLLNDTVYDIGFDTDGSLWFATGAGVCRLVDGIFQDSFTVVPSMSAANRQLHVCYSATDNAIQLAYQLERSVPISARLINMSGMVVGVWSGLSSLPGRNRVELPLSVQPGAALRDGIYIIQLIQEGRSDSEKLFITH